MEGMRNGYGEQTWKCGLKCEGNWYDNMFHGYMKCLDADGKVVIESTFQENEVE